MSYLPVLQRIQRWPSEHPNVSVRDMVTVHEGNLLPTKWSIARFVKTIAGDDKCVRVADVLLRDNKVYRSTIRNMCKNAHSPYKQYGKNASLPRPGTHAIGSRNEGISG